MALLLRQASPVISGRERDKKFAVLAVYSDLETGKVAIIGMKGNLETHYWHIYSGESVSPLSFKESRRAQAVARHRSDCRSGGLPGARHWLSAMGIGA